jgi:hypothetical protein
MADHRKELIRAYKETPRAFGVYRVDNTVNGTSAVDSSGYSPRARVTPRRNGTMMLA